VTLRPPAPAHKGHPPTRNLSPPHPHPFHTASARLPR
jgi:hypothetical protein